MPVVMLLAAAAILGGVVVAAMGRGGELWRTRQPSSSADFRTWSDVAEYRPPASLLGYQPRATESALAQIARLVAEQEEEIDWLRHQLAEVQPESQVDRPDGADRQDRAAPGTTGQVLQAGAVPHADPGLAAGPGMAAGEDR